MSRFTLSLVASAVLFIAGCTRTMTFRVVDPETHEPLAGISIDRSDMQFDPGLYFKITSAQTDAQGQVTLEIPYGEHLYFNPPVRPTRPMVNAAAILPHWTNGRRSVDIHDLWPQVTYTYYPHDKNAPLHTAVQAGGIVEIPIPNEVPPILARIDALLATNPPPYQSYRELQRALIDLAQVDAANSGPVFRKVFDKLTGDFNRAVAATASGRYVDLPEVTYPLLDIAQQSGAFDLNPYVVENLHHLYDTTASKMLPERAADFRQRLVDYHLW